MTLGLHSAQPRVSYCGSVLGHAHDELPILRVSPALVSSATVEIPDACCKVHNLDNALCKPAHASCACVSRQGAGCLRWQRWCGAPRVPDVPSDPEERHMHLWRPRLCVPSPKVVDLEPHRAVGGFDACLKLLVRTLHRSAATVKQPSESVGCCGWCQHWACCGLHISGSPTVVHCDKIGAPVGKCLPSGTW